MADRLAPMELRLMAAVSGGLEGVNVTRLCRELGVTTKTFYKWRHRFEAEGLAGLTPRSRRPKRSPTRTPVGVEDRIVELRKQLDDVGLDAGPATICWHLERGAAGPVPSEATVWRILCRRGFVSPAPKKRPRASWQRFEASAPNELWQIDGTDWALGDDTPVKIINVIDDHSRYVPASHAAPAETSDAAWAAFSNGVREIGMPSGCLSDNGLAFSGRLRGFEVAFEINLRDVGVRAITSAPYHPQTCGKVERFQQTLKKWLRSQPTVATITELQAQLDGFRGYYNHQRPHRAIGRITPAERLHASPRLQPAGRPSDALQRHVNATVNAQGIIQLQRWSIGLGVDYVGQPAEVYLNGTHANVFIHGTLVRHLQIDPNRRYQATGRKPGGPRRQRPT
jgi:transposase InsO family protein/transposase-like protein